MSFKDIDIDISYVNEETNSIAKSFISPVLAETVYYRRSVGYFSSGVLDEIDDGILKLVKKKGNIQLIASPKLSADDIAAINLGYCTKQAIIENAFSRDFNAEIEAYDENRLNLLAELIAKGFLNIKLAFTTDEDEYHDKLGIMIDSEGNSLAFCGSANSSKNGYRYNYEKIRVFLGWKNSDDKRRVDDEINEFNKLWCGGNDFVHVLDYTECAKRNIIFTIEQHQKEKRNKHIITENELRDYQVEAINAWVNHQYNGFMVMATGTGKTLTAIYATKKLLSSRKATIFICAPYKHLIKQWEEDIRNIFPDATVILVSSENQMWDNEIVNAGILVKHEPNKQLIIISTISSFCKERFSSLVNNIEGEKLLIVDEAHRFKLLNDYVNKTYRFKLGLSATPYNGKDVEKGDTLVSFFGGIVYNLPIEEAIKKKCLVEYYYHPIFVYATPDEEIKFNNYSRLIAGLFNNGKCIDEEMLVKYVRDRLRVISMAEDKMQKIDMIIDEIKNKDHFIVYCGDGRLTDSDKEMKYITLVNRALYLKGFKSSQFTAQENIKERLQLIKDFNNGDISSLAAIRCLDEGINIPSIQAALILSSGDSYREFVQRRGRILRQYENKNYADIYDVIVLPSNESISMAKIELRRFFEYARLSINKEENNDILNSELQRYGLSLDDINVFDYAEIREELEDE